MDIAVIPQGDGSPDGPGGAGALAKPGPAISLARPYLAHQPATPRDVLTIAFYHRRAMFWAFLVPLLLALVAAALSRPAYVAQARLLVLYGNEYFYQPVGGPPGGGAALDRNEIMQGELQVLRSTTLARTTIQAVGVDRIYPGATPGDPVALDRATRRFDRDLTVTAVPQSSVLELGFRNPDPEAAAAVLRALIAGYLDRRTAIFQRTPPAAGTAQGAGQGAGQGTGAAGTAADPASLPARLKQAEDALARYADAHGIADIDQQITLLVRQQADANQERATVRQAIGEAGASLAAIQQQLRQLPRTEQTYAESDRSQTSQVLTESLAKLQARRQDLATRYQESAPMVRDLDRQIAGLQGQIAQSPARQGTLARSGVNTVFQGAQAQEVALATQLAGLRAKETQLAATTAALDAKLMDLNKAARAYRDLQRNRDLLDEAYRNFSRGAEGARVAAATEHGDSANIRVVQPPERPLSGSDPRPLLLAGGVGVGVLAALAALAVANALRQVFVSARDTALGLELPVLAAVASQPGAAPRAGPATRALMLRPGEGDDDHLGPPPEPSPERPPEQARGRPQGEQEGEPEARPRGMDEKAPPDPRPPPAAAVESTPAGGAPKPRKMWQPRPRPDDAGDPA